MKNPHLLLRLHNSIVILAATLLLMSCKHEPPETIPPPVGKLTEDFFLQGDYILRYSFLVNDGMYTHLPSDSMYLRIGPVVNGISLIQWVQGNTVLEEEAVAEKNIDEANQNAYL